LDLDSVGVEVVAELDGERVEEGSEPVGGHVQEADLRFG